MEKIDSISAKETYDSRGKPTIEVTLCSGVHEAITKVPSGKSAGSREAFELRDQDGVGVSRAIANVNTTIADALIGTTLDPFAIDQKLITLDGTENKTHLGGNAMLGVSMAAMGLTAMVRDVPLWNLIAELSRSTPSFPFLYVNMLNGGAHASFRLPFQEYIVAVGGETMRDAYASANTIFAQVGKLVHEKWGIVPMGDEGGYSPEIQSIEEPFRLLRDAIGDTPEVFIAIDAAASEFFHDGRYTLLDTEYGPNELLAIYNILSKQYNLKSIEDPFDEFDFSPFEAMTKTMGARALIVGDDLTVTNPHIVAEMVRLHRANAMIIKPNQVGTMSEVFDAVTIARAAGWKLIASHRSGETDDTFMSDLAVGIGAYGLKAGAPTQMERRVKYERLIEIENEFNHNQ